VISDWCQSVSQGPTNIIDVCCGTGTIGLFVIKQQQHQQQEQQANTKLIGIEIIPQAIEDAKENAKLNGEFACDV
jgi:methylase of polypeptide subunit release factors